MPFNLLNPWALAIAAAVIPALLLLYFLRLRRREQRISSTLLWRKAVRDLQVNAPFQRLRRNLLLLLQLLVLSLAMLALARPVVETELSQAASVVVIIDRSASMNAIESDGRTRLDAAKEQAERFVRTLNQRTGSWLSMFSPELGTATRVMVIAFAEQAEVVVPFTTHPGEAVARIREITPTDGRTNLHEALELAEAYAAGAAIEAGGDPVEGASRILLLSDGRIRDSGAAAPRVGSIKYVPIGETADNVGVTALRAQRDYERPEMLSVFAQVENFSPRPARLDLTLYVDDRIQTVWDIDLAAARAGGNREDGDPEAPPEPANERRGSSAAVHAEFALDRAAVLEVRLARQDALAADNRAAVMAPEPRRLSVLLVSEKNYLLEQILRNLPLERFDYLTPEQYEAAPESDLLSDGRLKWDVGVFDKHDTARLPPGSYLFIEAIPIGIDGLERVGELESHAMLWWDETHPVLRYVSLDYIYAGRGIQIRVPPDAQKLIEGPAGPTLARVQDQGRHVLLLTFPLEISTFWQRAAGPVFFYNAIRFLGAGTALGELPPLRPGDSLVATAPAGADTVEVELPDGSRVRVATDAAGTARFGGTERAGIYTVHSGGQTLQRFAVNLEDAGESDIRPALELDLGQGVVVELGAPIETATPEIWRWFVAAALLIAMIEWVIYNRRVAV